VLLLAFMAEAPSTGAQPPAAEPLAEVNGDAITDKDLERALGTRLSNLEEQLYSLKRQGVEALIAERLLAQEAARRGVSVSELVDVEVRAKVEPVTDAEVDAAYQANKARLPGNEAAGRVQMRALLKQRKTAARRAAFVSALRAQANVTVRLQPPSIVRVAVPTDGAPARGPAEAPVTVVEFSDYHCPFCKRAQTTLTQILERYPGKVRHVYRDFPVDTLHPHAREAAEGARCAQDQGKFWDFHDVLFASTPHTTAADLRKYAELIGLDGSAFERCLAAGTHRAAVQRDIDEGRRLGVSGTPAFFINGRSLTGAQPVEAFARIIEEELARR
jgi:protein-disulfide isomerase